MTRLDARLARSVLLALPIALSLAGAALAAAEGGGGLPQLDARTYPSQIFWLIVSFALLYRLLKTKAIPRIADILETRQDRIGADLDRAARLRADAEAALKKHDSILAEAQARRVWEDSGRTIPALPVVLKPELKEPQGRVDGMLALRDERAIMDYLRGNRLLDNDEVDLVAAWLRNRNLPVPPIRPKEGRYRLRGEEVTERRTKV